MGPGSSHTIHSEHTSFVWDNSLEPVAEVESGATVELETIDASGGQLNRSSGAGDVAAMDLTRVNPVTGPIYVKGAQAGDVLQIDIRELKPNDWGWTAIIPDFGVLADEFPDPWLNISTVDASAGRVRFLDGVTVPFAPFPGTIGVPPPEPGQHSVLPPSKWGGNLDIKHLRAGTTLYLPVAVPGALFSVGDTHAAMGDGEVCGTAVESAMDIAVRLTVRRDLSLRYPQYDVPSAHDVPGASQAAVATASGHGLTGGQPAQARATGYHVTGYHVCTGVGPDLMEAAREATRATIDYVQERYGRTRQEAYAIASVAADLKIHEIVDAPNWVVGAFLPEAIFEAA